jgi:sarcosine oxidase
VETKSFDVIVVGLGAMGSATAFHLARGGARVLGIDQFAPPHAMGSSHGESRIIRELYYEHPMYVPLLQRAYTLWEELARDSANPELLRITGGLFMGAEDSAVVRGIQRSAREHGLACTLLDRHTLRQRYPQFSLPETFVGVLDPRAGILDPEACVRAHLEMAQRHGATLLTGTRVLRWSEEAGGVRVETANGTFTAGRLVLAAGGWTNTLLGDRALPLTLERQTIVWFDPPGNPASYEPARFPVFLVEFSDGQLVYGFPTLKRGWKVAVHYQGEPVDSADTLDRVADERDVERVRTAAARMFPSVWHARVREAAVCLYTDSPDLRFVVGALPGFANVIVCSACSGHGFKFASVIGESLAALAGGRAPLFDLSAFGPERFA